MLVVNKPMIYFLFVSSSGILHLPSEKTALLRED